VATIVASTILLAVYSVLWHAMQVEARASIAWRDHEVAQRLVDEIADSLENAANPPNNPAIEGHAHQKQGDYSLTCFVGPGFRRGKDPLEAAYRWRRYSWNVFPGTERLGKMNVISIPCAGSRSISSQAQQTRDGSADWEHVDADLLATCLKEFSIRYRSVSKADSTWQDNYRGQVGDVAVWIHCMIGQEVVEQVIVPRTAGSLLTGRQQ
jgi:hypothetical protein